MKVLGDYALLEQLGAGGMGVVYLAEHQATHARYAVKLVTQLDPETLLRFQREAEAHARVDAHPNVVRLHTCGRCDEGPYLVMEHATGGNLAARLEQGLLPARATAELLRDLAKGLAWIHAAGVLHRDLKPANVLFSEDVPKLTDFGLAHLEEGDSLTQTGTILGTPQYMAPEQAGTGRGQTVATDVYGLGAILYHCLAGRPPFQGNSTISVMLDVLKSPPVPPSRLRRDVDLALERLCLDALEKEPEDRPSLAAFAERLEQILSGEAEPSRAPWIATGVAALALTILAAWAIASASVTPPQPPHATSPSASSTISQAPTASPQWEPPPPPSSFPLKPARLRDPRKLAEFQLARREEANDPVRALSVYEGLVRDEAGLIRIQPARMVGQLLASGRVKPDPPRALELFLEAAIHGSSESIRVLGLGYLPPDQRALLVEETFWLSQKADWPGVASDADIAAAATVLLRDGESENASGFEDQVLDRLRKGGTRIPHNSRAAYLYLWRRLHELREKGGG